VWRLLKIWLYGHSALCPPFNCSDGVYLIGDKMRKPQLLFAGIMIALASLACGTEFDLDPTPTLMQMPGGIPSPTPGEQISGDEIGTVTRIVDGDTIEVNIDGVIYDVRYIGVNTPERDEPCYAEATEANRALVEGQVVTLVKDVSETDRYGRLLRYVYVGDLMVNELLVANGWAEAVLYEPDSAYWQQFVMLEQAVENLDIGCRSTGIFDDGSYER
jgi:endonuclease YncB( thermonuclease family)